MENVTSPSPSHILFSAPHISSVAQFVNSSLILESCSPRRMSLSSCQPSCNSPILSSSCKLTSLLSTKNFSLCYNAWFHFYKLLFIGRGLFYHGFFEQAPTNAFHGLGLVRRAVRPSLFPAACRVGIRGGVGASSSSDEG